MGGRAQWQAVSSDIPGSRGVSLSGLWCVCGGRGRGGLCITESTPHAVLGIIWTHARGPGQKPCCSRKVDHPDLDTSLPAGACLPPKLHQKVTSSAMTFADFPRSSRLTQATPHLHGGTLCFSGSQSLCKMRFNYKHGAEFQSRMFSLAALTSRPSHDLNYVLSNHFVTSHPSCPSTPHRAICCSVYINRVWDAPAFREVCLRTFREIRPQETATH